mmetsp:Transcript_12975/g.46069  ORF Transcript_12975/g.46069 Transcript_12975/m.46069 type:complete len:270 (+) Transcript_12975:1195-2004(+)
MQHKGLRKHLLAAEGLSEVLPTGPGEGFAAHLGHSCRPSCWRRNATFGAVADRAAEERVELRLWGIISFGRPREFVDHAVVAPGTGRRPVCRRPLGCCRWCRHLGRREALLEVRAEGLLEGPSERLLAFLLGDPALEPPTSAEVGEACEQPENKGEGQGLLDLQLLRKIPQLPERRRQERPQPLQWLAGQQPSAIGRGQGEEHAQPEGEPTTQQSPLERVPGADDIDGKQKARQRCDPEHGSYEELPPLPAGVCGVAVRGAKCKRPGPA